MNKYQWDTYEILTNMRTLFKMLTEETDYNKKEYISGFISQYEDMLFQIGCTDVIDRFEAQTGYKNPGYNKQENDMQYFNQYDDEIKMYLYNTYPIVKNAEIYDFNQSYDISDDVIVNCSKEFLKEVLDKETYNKYNNLKMENQDFLHIQHKPIYNNSSTTYNGFTYIDPILNKKYVLLNKHDCLTDFGTLAHELFHFIFNDPNNAIDNGIENNYISEIEGSFAEFVASDFYSQVNNNAIRYLSEFITEDKIGPISQHLSSCIGEAISSHSLSQYKKNIEKMVVADIGTNIASGNYEFNFYNAIGIFQECYQLFCQNKRYYLDTPIGELMRYTLSYLAAADLYTIYKQDKNRAFQILNNIKYSPSTNNTIELLRNNGITFMDDGYKNLQRLANIPQSHNIKRK